MTPSCSTCADHEPRPTTIGGRPFTAELCRRMGMVTTALARMAWTHKGLPSAAPHCGPSGSMWRAA